MAPEAACALCGATGVRLERHHVAGRAIDPALTVPLCTACHDELSEGQRLRRADLAHGRERSLPETIVAVLREAGHFLVALGERLVYWSEQLAAFTAALAQRCPGWRQWPESQPPRDR